MGSFPETRWSLILRAADGHREALQHLCGSYWSPLYGFARRKGYGEEDARDLVQGFLERLLARGDLAQIAPERGRFRSYLLAGMQHWQINEAERARAAKRGGGAVDVPWEDAEARYQGTSAAQLTPEQLYDRMWTLALIERAIAKVEAACVGEQRERFVALRGYLVGEGEAPYRQTASALGLTEGALKVAIHRFRKRVRAALREEVAATLEDPADVDDELGRLMGTLS